MIVTPVKVKAYAHCLNPLCAGYGQEEVDAVQTTVEYTYGDNGADMFKSMVERSTVSFDFADGEDRPCRSCKKTRELTGSPRPSYQPMSGHDPMGLVNGVMFNPNVVNTQQDADMAEMKAQMARQSALIDQLLAAATDTPEVT